VDDDVAARVHELAGAEGVVAIAPSHPHMFGAQLEWSRRLGELRGRQIPVLVSRADLAWVARPGAAITANGRTGCTTTSRAAGSPVQAPASPHGSSSGGRVRFCVGPASPWCRTCTSGTVG